MDIANAIRAAALAGACALAGALPALAAGVPASDPAAGAAAPTERASHRNARSFYEARERAALSASSVDDGFVRRWFGKGAIESGHSPEFNYVDSSGSHVVDFVKANGSWRKRDRSPQEVDATRSGVQLQQVATPAAAALVRSAPQTSVIAPPKPASK